MSMTADEIIYSKRKRLAISVLPGGKVVVRAPLKTRTSIIQDFINANQVWIAAAKTKMSAIPEQTVYHFCEGEAIWYLGKTYPLHLVPKVKGGFIFEPGKYFLLQADQQEWAAALLTAFYRKETRQLTSGFIEHYTLLTGLRPSVVRINSARTRWGSCSAKNALNFSFRLAMTPIECVEYIVVHELAHIRHHNHSANYWALVAKLLPDFKIRRTWLKRNGLSIPTIP
ncbi:MAG: SprT family zinc-dependent metalloprotease [Anaerolineaceae bacterium]